MRVRMITLGLLAGSLFLSGCNKNYALNTASPASSALSTTSGPTNPPPSNTTPCQITSVSQNLKIIFMVDDSGSTASTDPNDVNRVATVQAFLTKYSSKTNLTYSYAFFGTNSEAWSVSSNSFTASSADVFGTAANAEAALNKFVTLPTAGTTNYEAAFFQIETILQADNAATNNDNYVVIFMSDGQPKDLGNSASDQINGISGIAANLLGSTAAGRITLSTVYFGPNSDTQSENNLSTMATLGGGQFINSNVTTSYSIDNLITVPVQACTN
jgi:hypothetical protein